MIRQKKHDILVIPVIFCPHAHISIKMSKELLARAKEAADKEETTVSALIRRLLLEYFKTFEELL